MRQMQSTLSPEKLENFSLTKPPTVKHNCPGEIWTRSRKDFEEGWGIEFYWVKTFPKLGALKTVNISPFHTACVRKWVWAQVWVVFRNTWSILNDRVAEAVGVKDETAWDDSFSGNRISVWQGNGEIVGGNQICS